MAQNQNEFGVKSPKLETRRKFETEKVEENEIVDAGRWLNLFLLTNEACQYTKLKAFKHCFPEVLNKQIFCYIS